MTTIATALRGDVTTSAHQPEAANGLALVRVTIGEPAENDAFLAVARSFA